MVSLKTHHYTGSTLTSKSRATCETAPLRMLLFETRLHCNFVNCCIVARWFRAAKQLETQHDALIHCSHREHHLDYLDGCLMAVSFRALARHPRLIHICVAKQHRTFLSRKTSQKDHCSETCFRETTWSLQQLCQFFGILPLVFAQRVYFTDIPRFQSRLQS